MATGRDEELSKKGPLGKLPGSAQEIGPILDSISDAFIFADDNWYLTYVNEKAEILFRHSRQDLIGKNLLQDFPGLLGTEFETHYKRAKETGKPSTVEAFYKPHNTWLEGRIYPRPEGFLIYYIDITQRKRREITWAISESLLLDISTSDNLSTAFEKALRTLIKNTEWTYGQIWRSREGTVYINHGDPYVYSSENQLSFREDSVGKLFDIKQGILKTVSETGELYFIPDLEKDHNLKRRESALAAGFRSWLGIPIVSNGRFYEIELLSENVLTEEAAHLDLLRVVSKRFAEIVSRRAADEERKAMIELSSDIILTISSDCLIRKVNPAFSKLLGYERKHLINKNLLDFLHPEDVGMTKLNISTVSKEKFESRCITKDGRVCYLFWNMVQSPDSGTIFCIGRDITEDKLTLQKLESAAEELNRSKEQLQKAQKIAKMGSWTMELEGELSWSLGLYEMFELDPKTPAPNFEEFIGFVHPDDRERILKNYEVFLLEGVFEEAELRIVTREGKEKFVMVKGEVILSKQGKVIGSSGTMQDITEEKEWNDSLRQLQKMEAVGQLAGGMAHDFNNLLNIILANLDLLELHLRETPELLKRVFSAQDAVQRGAELNRRLLSFSRKQAVNPEVADVNHVISDFLPIVSKIRNDMVSLEFCSEDFPLVCSFEKNGLENALLNLCLNARDAMPKGGRILISVAFSPGGKENHTALLGALEIGDACVISVRDEGVGMDPSTQERVFEPFFTTKETGKGTGLGMPMVYGFVKQSNGAISVYSEPNKGTTIDIYLPLVREPELLTADEIPLDRRYRKILLVEKSLKGENYLCALLKRAGYEILHAYDIYESRAVLESETGIVAVFVDEELCLNDPDSVGWEKLKSLYRVITISEWNAKTQEKSENDLKRPYNWSKLRRLLGVSVLDRDTV
ncbi:PAS domain S-box protein [Leptospira langatensis]|uniref:histidine kinase n=1 Tax=Leptospira langatensis TaxID=2484983 RepID=A0A5F1ZTE3_9LEPT|nr:PAS domain S-box protein [Leptospira langatensis]TGJ98955.1 PAS domain S-box protein [Leptospira langatensis]TGL40476.1 PAS domain S-box protein [Leptospira langatensis]